MGHALTHIRELKLSQPDYVEQLVEKHGREAAHTEGSRAEPAAKIQPPTSIEEGIFQGSRRSIVGARIFLARATNPVVTYATNWLPRTATLWARTHDMLLGQRMGYLSAARDRAWKQSPLSEARRTGCV